MKLDVATLKSNTVNEIGSEISIVKIKQKIEELVAFCIHEYNLCLEIIQGFYLCSRCVVKYKIKSKF